MAEMQLVEQLTLDPEVKGLNPVACNTKRRQKKANKTKLIDIAQMVEQQTLDLQFKDLNLPAQVMVNSFKLPSLSVIEQVTKYYEQLNVTEQLFICVCCIESEY